MFTEAQLYSDSSFCQQRKAEAMLSVYRDRLRWQEHEYIIDIGSGPGIITSYLAQMLPENVSRIVGVDVSSKMVSHARREFKSNKLSFYRMDITERFTTDLRQYLPPEIKEAKFNKVFCFYLLHWLAEKFQQALYNIENLLKKGGQGMAIHYISIPVFDSYTVIGKKPKWAPFLRGVVLDYNPLRLCDDPCGYMEKSLIEAGLHPEDISQYSSHNVYHSVSDLVGLMTSIDPFIQYIPKEMHSEYMEDFLAILLPRCQVSQSGTIAVPFTIMNCLFTKK